MFSICHRFSRAGQNIYSRFLTANTSFRIKPRNKMSDLTAISISLQSPVSDYKKLIDDLLERNLDDGAHQQRYKAIAAETRNVAWKLLFEKSGASKPDDQNKAGDLLVEHKPDACFYCPWDYNDWIGGVRDELLKREMHDFWHNVMVKKSLGPCWARDSDYFDDMEDPAPGDFYRFAGAIPPWENKDTSTSNPTTTEDNSLLQPTANASANAASLPTIKISIEQPLEDYSTLMKKYLTENTTSGDEEAQKNYKAIAECARNVVWALLFDEPQPPSEDRQNKAGNLLREHKMDACFYAPWEYNDWIVKLRDEVLKRELLDFWRNHFVKHALGLCWAKDSDFYDDMNDKRPEEFYKHAGAVAPWLKEESDNKANERKNTSA